MPDRRKNSRDKAIYSGVAEIDGEIDGNGTTTDCIVHNISEKRARAEFGNVVRPTRELPKERALPSMMRKRRSFLARVIRWRDNFVSVAFNSEPPSELPVSDLAERLHKSEQKKRQLQRRIKELLDEN